MDEAESPGSGGSPPNSDAGAVASISSDELEHLPLVRRRIMLLAEKQRSNPPMLGIVVKEEEDEGCNSLDVPSLMPACSSREAGVSGQEQNHEHGNPSEISPRVLCHKVVEHSALDSCLQNGTSGTSRDCSSDYSMKMNCIESNDDVAEVGKLDANMSPSLHSSMISEFSPRVQVEYFDNMLHSVGGGINSSSTAGVQTMRVKSEICDDATNDHLDHIVLKERQRMLLSRKLLELEKPVLEGAVKGKENIHVVGEPLPVKSHFDEIHEMYPEVLQTTEAFSLPDENDRISSSARKSMESNSYGGKDALVYTSGMNVPSISTSIKIKDEPQDGKCHNLDLNARDTFSFDISMLKTKSEITDELDEDEADHMCLGDRVKLVRPGGADNVLNTSQNRVFSKKSVHLFSGGNHMASDSAKAFSINRPRKRKKTATDSIETALEEDAPGLLQVLVEKGVSIDEIRLYGETESDEALDESSCEDTFSELESVISKIFAQRTSFLKFPPVRCMKGARASYCLACLISLVEQARYLQFRKWPVEWGWCRDLQSFIFVFERHKRIVLERPEYGYATYFFELDPLPIDWQIKRLVTAMTFTTCSRISLIENKPLSVGEDLTEGEAKVLIGYGWLPNTGLGTMLKYCDRVVHDRKNEKDTTEWRSKIGKLLMEGYNGGTVVATDVVDKVLEYRDSQDAQIKLEI